MKIRKWLLLKLMQTKWYSYLLLYIIPYIRFSTYYTTMRGWKYKRGYKLLQPGDILVTIDRKKLTTLLIGGEFTHAALCVSIIGEWEISEMTHTNYTKSCFFDLCKEADRVVILRCKDWDNRYIHEVIEKCKTFVDCKYDIDFDFGVKELYCSELVYQSDFERRLKVDISDLAGIGQPYVSPTDIFEAKNIIIVWDSDKEVI